MRTDPTRERRLATALSLGMVAAVLAPVRQNWRRRPVDGFPLSYYPMFSARRRATVRAIHLVGIDGTGGRICIPHHCAGTGGLNQVRRQINRACGEGGALGLCAAIAEHVAHDAAFDGIRTVQVVESSYRIDDYFLRRDAAAAERVLAAAEVVRGTA